MIGAVPLHAMLSAATMNFAALNPLKPSAAVSKLFPNANAAASSAASNYGASDTDSEPLLNQKDPGRYPPPPAGMSTTTKIAIAGGALVALAAVVVIAKKRKKRR